MCAFLGLVAEVHVCHAVSHTLRNLVHGITHAGFEVSHALAGGFLRLLQFLIVLDHLGKVSVRGRCHAGNGVYRILATIGKAGNNSTQTVNVSGAGVQALKILVIAVPVGDLALQCGVDAGCRGGDNLFSGIPQVILSADALQGCIIGLVIGRDDALNIILGSRQGGGNILGTVCGRILCICHAVDCGRCFLILGLGSIYRFLILCHRLGVVLYLPPGSHKVCRIAEVFAAQLLHILAHGTPRNVLNSAISQLKLLVRHAEGGKQLIIAGSHAGIGLLNLDFCSVQLDLVLCAFA